MSATEVLLRQPAAEAIAWALLHFIWQGALIGVITAAALAVLKRSAPDVRYVVAAIALSLMLTMPVVTAVQLWRVASAAPSGPTPHVTTAVEPSRTQGASSPTSSAVNPAAGDRNVARAAIVDAGVFNRAAIEGWLPVLLMAWLAGVSLLTLRLMSGWFWIQRLRTHSEIADDTWQQMARRLCRRLHIARSVRLLESSLVEVPTVIGWMKPVVLLPGSVLAGLSPRQLEAILAHELAHIRRHDYLVNLVQTLVETLLFYHPAVWWVSGRIRAERENCCDDLAVSLCGDPYTYATALADLEERRGSRGRLVLAASGGSLLQRVRRLLGAPASHAGRGPGWLAGTAAVLVLAGIVAGALGHDVMQAQQGATVPVVAEPAAPVRAVSAPVAPGTTQPAAVVVPTGATPHVQESTVVKSATAPAIASTPLVAGDIQPALAPSTAVDSGVVMPAPVMAAPALATTVIATPAIAAPVVAPAQRLEASAAVRSQETSGNFVWSNNGEKLSVDFRGDVEFTDDDTDVRRLSPGGYLKIKDGGWFRGRTIEFRADPSGNLERRYWVGTSERPFEPEGRQWLAQVLPRFIRQTAMGSERRVARILKASGTSGVLAEISRIEGGWAKRVYFKELLRQTSPDAGAAQKILAQAGREIESDYELASLLIESSEKLLVDEATRTAYFDAARTIESDYEMRRTLSAALKRSAATPALLAGLLDASRSIDSDFELAELLVQVARNHPIDAATSRPFFAAADTIGSDYEQRRVLTTVAARRDLAPDTSAALLGSAMQIESDFELAELLSALVKDREMDGVLRAPFFRAVDSIQSGYDRSRVLLAVARRPAASAETIMAIVKAVRGMGSHEASQVLLAVAAAHTLTGPTRDLYIDAAADLADYEQGRVLTALVRSERRK